MAKFVYKDAYVTVNSVDLSAHVTKVTVQGEFDKVPMQSMGDAANWNLPGLKNWSVSVDFRQDFASGSVDATLSPLNGGASFPVAVRAVKGAAKSATNPQWDGTARLFSYSPVDASVGGEAAVSVTFEPGDGTDLARST